MYKKVILKENNFICVNEDNFGIIFAILITKSSYFYLFFFF